MPSVFARLGGAQIYLKREDLNPNRRAQDQQHHRPSVTGKTHGEGRVSLPKPGGQHGVAAATVAAR